MKRLCLLIVIGGIHVYTSQPYLSPQKRKRDSHGEEYNKHQKLAHYTQNRNLSRREGEYICHKQLDALREELDAIPCLATTTNGIPRNTMDTLIKYLHRRIHAIQDEAAYYNTNNLPSMGISNYIGDIYTMLNTVQNNFTKEHNATIQDFCNMLDTVSHASARTLMQAMFRTIPITSRTLSNLREWYILTHEYNCEQPPHDIKHFTRFLSHETLAHLHNEYSICTVEYKQHIQKELYVLEQYYDKLPFILLDKEI